MAQYKIFNGPAPTTAARAAVTTGTTIKTMLQVKGIAAFHLLGWGVSMPGATDPLLAGVEWEILTTGTVAATVTAHVELGIIKWATRTSELTVPVLAATKFTLGTAATGYTASAEGTVAVANTFDSKFVLPYKTEEWMFHKPISLPATDYLRIRCKAAAAVDAICYMIVQAP